MAVLFKSVTSIYYLGFKLDSHCPKWKFSFKLWIWKNYSYCNQIDALLSTTTYRTYFFATLTCFYPPFLLLPDLEISWLWQNFINTWSLLYFSISAYTIYISLIHLYDFSRFLIGLKKWKFDCFKRPFFRIFSQ